MDSLSKTSSQTLARYMLCIINLLPVIAACKARLCPAMDACLLLCAAFVP